MPKLPAVSARELIKVLKKDGFQKERSQGSHHIFYHEEKKITISVPVHPGKDLGAGITKAILRDAQITDQFFIKHK